jgi:hypothetical protein
LGCSGVWRRKRSHLGFGSSEQISRGFSVQN